VPRFELLSDHAEEQQKRYAQKIATSMADHLRWWLNCRKKARQGRWTPSPFTAVRFRSS
jgi:hypothetical protein